MSRGLLNTDGFRGTRGLGPSGPRVPRRARVHAVRSFRRLCLQLSWSRVPACLTGQPSAQPEAPPRAAAWPHRRGLRVSPGSELRSARLVLATRPDTRRGPVQLCWVGRWTWAMVMDESTRPAVRRREDLSSPFSAARTHVSSAGCWALLGMGSVPGGHRPPGATLCWEQVGPTPGGPQTRPHPAPPRPGAAGA